MAAGDPVIHLRQTSYRDFSRKTKRSYPDPLISRSPIIDGVLSLNNYRLCDFVDRIYPIELEIEDADRSATPLN